MTTAAAGRMLRPRLRRRVSGPLLAVLLVAVAAWLAVHLTMPAFYARWWYPLEHAEAIRAEAAANGLEPEFVAAVIYRESRFSETARSGEGAVGLMQVMPETAHWITRQPGSPQEDPHRLADPAVNIAFGTWYLRYLSGKYGSERLALAAYNGGEANLREWIAEARAAGKALATADVPFPETRKFIEGVEESRATYRRIWGDRLG